MIAVGTEPYNKTWHLSYSADNLYAQRAIGKLIAQRVHRQYVHTRPSPVQQVHPIEKNHAKNELTSA